MRTFLGVLASIPFLFVISGMVVMLAFSRTYFDAETLNEKIIPDSYNNATLLVAEHFSATDREMTSVLVERVRSLITPSDYIALVQTGFDEATKALETAEDTEEIHLNMIPVKEKLTTLVENATGRMGTCTDKEMLKSQTLLCVPREFNLDEGRVKLKQNLVLLVKNEIPDVVSFKEPQQEIPSEATASTTLQAPDMRAQFKQLREFGSSATLVHKGITSALIIAIIAYAAIQLIIQFSAARVMYFVGGMIFIVSGMVRTIAANIADIPRVIGAQNQLTYGQEQLMRFVISEPLPLLTKMSTVLSVVGILIIVCGILYKKQMAIRKSDTVL